MMSVKAGQAHLGHGSGSLGFPVNIRLLFHVRPLEPSLSVAPSGSSVGT